MNTPSASTPGTSDDHVSGPQSTGIAPATGAHPSAVQAAAAAASAGHGHWREWLTLLVGMGGGAMLVACVLALLVVLSAG